MCAPLGSTTASFTSPAFEVIALGRQPVPAATRSATAANANEFTKSRLMPTLRETHDRRPCHGASKTDLQDRKQRANLGPPRRPRITPASWLECSKSGAGARKAETARGSGLRETVRRRERSAHSGRRQAASHE